MNINFRKITEDNFNAIIQMKRPEEEHFVASNAISLAQAWLYKDNNDVIKKIIELARESGKYDFLTLDYVQENEAAKHVYEKVGFQPTL